MKILRIGYRISVRLAALWYTKTSRVKFCQYHGKRLGTCCNWPLHETYEYGYRVFK